MMRGPLQVAPLRYHKLLTIGFIVMAVFAALLAVGIPELDSKIRQLAKVEPCP